MVSVLNVQISQKHRTTEKNAKQTCVLVVRMFSSMVLVPFAMTKLFGSTMVCVKNVLRIKLGNQMASAMTLVKNTKLVN